MATHEMQDNSLGVPENFASIPKFEHPAFVDARQSNIESLTEKLDRGLDVNLTHRETPGDTIYTIKWLVRAMRLKSYTLLHMAVAHGSLQTVELLLSRGADVNLADANQITPLSLASAVPRVDVVKALLEAGADPNIQSISGRTPLIQAITVRNIAIVQMLLEAGADPNLADSKGLTPLTNSLMDNPFSVDILLALIKSGAKIEQANKQGATPLMTAVGLGKQEAVIALVEAGADINKVDAAGKSVFQFAIGTRLALYLINNGADVDASDNSGQRPLDWAARVGHIGMLRLLLGVDCQRPSLELLEVPRVVQARQSVPVFDTWITQELTQPRDLRRICRGVIRQTLGLSGMAQVDQLPLPGMVKNYILARGIDLSFGGLSIEKWQRLPGLSQDHRH